MFENATYSVCVGDNDVAKFATEVVKREEVAAKILQLANEQNLSNVGRILVKNK